MGDIDEYIFDDDGNPVLSSNFGNSQNSMFADEDDTKDIFHIKGDGYDVTLSLARGILSWANVNPTGKKKGIFKGKKTEENQSVALREIFGVQLRRKKTNNVEEEGLCIGFSIHIPIMMGAQNLAERVVLFEHPSEALNTMYVRKISSYMDVMRGRPKFIKLFLQTHAGNKHGNSIYKAKVLLLLYKQLETSWSQVMRGRPKFIKLFLQTHAGNKHGNSIYKAKVLPLLQTAGINVDCVEVQHNEHIKQEMVHINLDDFDCVVAMGGDGTVNKVADGLLTASQKYRDIEQKSGFTPTRARIPLGIIPIGSTNDTARSIMGTDDPITAALHIVMGEKIPVDVCSLYVDDKFQQWCFNCQYGFAGNVLALRKRYKALGRRGLEAAFVKALTKAKLRSYKCDVEYIPAERPPSAKRNIPCWQGCDICWNADTPDDNEVTQDLVQAFDPLAESNDSDTLVDLAQHEETPWRSVKGDYMNVGLFTITGRSEMAPRGLSKYTHLNDGTIDLALVKETDRKEFIRLIKRLGNNKDQFDFPFVEHIKATEIRFRLRLPTGFNYNDYSYSELDYELERRKRQTESALSRSVEILEIDDLSDDDDDDDDVVDSGKSTPKPTNTQSKSKPPMLRKGSLQTIPTKKLFKRTNTEVEMVVDSLDSDSEEDNSSGSEEEVVSVDINGVRTVRSANAEPQRLVGPAYRMTFAEKDRAKRKKRAMKKEEKKKAREEQKSKTVWNVDNEILNADILHLRVHHGLLKIFGLGIHPDSVKSDTTILCLPRL